MTYEYNDIANWIEAMEAEAQANRQRAEDEQQQWEEEKAKILAQTFQKILRQRNGS